MPLEWVIPSTFATAIAVPWLVWVTLSIFNQRQEIAVLKEILKALVKQGHNK